jgi:hypothetical protein
MNPTTAAENTIDMREPGRFSLGLCQSDSQLDCLEPKIVVTHKDGSSSTALHTYSGTSAPFITIGERDPLINHQFKVRSGNNNGNFKDFSVSAALSTPTSKPFGLAGVRVYATKKLSADECDDPFKKLCKRFTLDPEDKFKVVVRFQKLPVQGLTATALNGNVTREDYLLGEKWIFTGSQTLIGWNPGMSWGLEPIGEGAQFGLRSDPQCAGKGVLFTSSNGVHRGLPSWDKRKNSLNFGVQGPHLDANGDLFRGFFKTRIPKKWLDCVHPENTLTMASEVAVSITYDDGSTQVATSSTRVTDELIYINVPLLHFSSPTIRVTNASLATPAPTPKVVNCIKGKVKKTFKASKCPSGWKLVG